MQCPRCRNRPLTTHRQRASGVAVDVCALCRGILFDAGELDRILDVAARDLRPPTRTDHAPTVLCPRCFSPMTAFEYPQTMAVVDMCPKCHAVWLDGGELAEIHTVRVALKRRNALDRYAPVRGLKGALLRFISSALARLSSFE